MTDINLAYADINNDEEEPSIYQQQPSQQHQHQQPSQQQLAELQKKREIELQQHQPSQESLNYQYQQQPQYLQPQKQQQQQQKYPEYSFWDRMIMSKREVLKLFILSIVIILGISIEKVLFHYMNSYLSSTDLSTYQEFFVRLSLPIIIFIILWIIKSL
jgi:ABC-type bacteriocin/lantibiotic exporter with double-glycine peptidase domain